MTTPTNIEERVSRLEGGYEHLAAKADVERLRADMTAEIGRVRAEVRDSKISTVLWLTGIMAGLLSAAIAILRLWPG